MYEFDDDEEGGRSLGRTLGIGAAVIALALMAWFVVKPRLTDDNDGGEAVGSSQSTAPAADAATEATSASSDGTVVAGVNGSTTTVTGAAASATSTTGARANSTTTTSGSTTTAASTTTTTDPPTTTVPAPPYALPDGSPAPVIATYNTNSISLTGAVPDQAAKDRLQALAVANAKPGQADLVDNQLVLNPAVPRNVGVRVVELRRRGSPTAASRSCRHTRPSWTALSRS